MSVFNQDDRLARIDTPLGRDVLLLVRIAGQEDISRPFRFDLELQSTRTDIDPDEMLRKPVVVSWLLRDGSRRFVHGHINRFGQGASDAALTSYRAELVPWLQFLSLRRDCRVFQNMSVPDIVAEVFRRACFSDFEVRCADRPVREYCVQYGESDLNFVQRLMEEEGIFYFFEHTERKHILVMADALAHTRECPPPANVSVSDASAPGEDTVTFLEWEKSVRIGTVTYRDYDHVQPNFTLEGQAPGQAGEERYEYWPGRYTTRDDGERLAGYQLEAEEALREGAHGRSGCRNLIAGHRFRLEEHTNARANQEYLLTSVQHDCRNGEYRSDGAGQSFDYSNAFTCVSARVPYRTRRNVRKPLIRGSQTAVVVGPPGEEIYPDEFGRVKVQFHWDRLGRGDDHSSCWVRVSQPWAGQGWGAQFLPRVGQEVIVDFLDGDPDQPIIVGRVYNARNLPPYQLPANKTQSGFRSDSSPGGSSHHGNEIRFEDRKGSEELYLHAERNLATVVEQDETRAVRGARSTTIRRNDALVIESGNREVEIVEGDDILVVKGGRHSVSTSGAQQYDGEEVTISGKRVVVSGGAEIEIQAGTALKLSAGVEVTIAGPGGTIKIGPAGVAIDGTMILLNCGAAGGGGGAAEGGGSAASAGRAPRPVSVVGGA
jgi:type VI secretion system secreted protein VgrG